MYAPRFLPRSKLGSCNPLQERVKKMQIGPARNEQLRYCRGHAVATCSDCKQTA